MEKWLLVARFVDCVSFFGSECSKEEAHVDEVELLIPDPFSGYVVYLENAVRWYELDQRVSFMIIIGICLFRKGGASSLTMHLFGWVPKQYLSKFKYLKCIVSALREEEWEISDALGCAYLNWWRVEVYYNMPLLANFIETERLHSIYLTWRFKKQWKMNPIFDWMGVLRLAKESHSPMP